MAASSLGGEPDDVTAAMTQVLEAERASTAMVAESRARATATLDKARGRAQSISRRAIERTAGLHVRYLASIEQRIQQEEAASQAKAEAAGRLQPNTEALMRQAVDRLAARLTS